MGTLCLRANTAMLAIATFIVYYVMAVRMHTHYALSLFINIGCTIIAATYLIAITKCLLMFFATTTKQTWLLRLSQIIGIFELFVMIVVSSLFWMYEYLNAKSIKWLIGLPLLCLLNAFHQMHVLRLVFKFTILPLCLEWMLLQKIR